MKKYIIIYTSVCHFHYGSSPTESCYQTDWWYYHCERSLGGPKYYVWTFFQRYESSNSRGHRPWTPVWSGPISILVQQPLRVMAIWLVGVMQQVTIFLKILLISQLQTPATNITNGEYDIAHKMWGSDWRYPTAEMKELIDSCTWSYDATKKGYTITSNKIWQ